MAADTAEPARLNSDSFARQGDAHALLFRPVGVAELELIAASGWRSFPPRLEGQPYFYPVLNREYAEQIARDWNTGDPASGFAGFVTEFELDDSLAAHYERHVVGGQQHEELWVPAGELDRFNAHVRGSIRVVAAHYGNRYQGAESSSTGLPDTVSTPHRAD